MLEAGGDADLAQEPVRADRGGELGAQGLDGDLAPMPPVLREEDRGHAALADQALDVVAIAERGTKLLQDLGHYLPQWSGSAVKINGGDGCQDPPPPSLLPSIHSLLWIVTVPPVESGRKIP